MKQFVNHTLPTDEGIFRYISTLIRHFKLTEYIPKVLSYKPHKKGKISNTANGQFVMACNENSDHKTALFLLENYIVLKI